MREIVGDVLLTDSSSVLFGFEGVGGDNGFLEVDGDLTLDGTAVIDDLGGLEAGTYRLFEVTGEIANLGLDLLFSGVGSQFESQYTTSVAIEERSGSDLVNLVLDELGPPPIEVVPESGSGLLVGLGLGLLAVVRSRSR